MIGKIIKLSESERRVLGLIGNYNSEYVLMKDVKK